MIGLTTSSQNILTINEIEGYTFVFAILTEQKQFFELNPNFDFFQRCETNAGSYYIYYKANAKTK